MKKTADKSRCVKMPTNVKLRAHQTPQEDTSRCASTSFHRSVGGLYFRIKLLRPSHSAGMALLRVDWHHLDRSASSLWSAPVEPQKLHWQHMAHHCVPLPDRLQLQAQFQDDYSLKPKNG